MPNTVRIAMWSGPRNISTAMMRAWENRPDTAVMDEPFYGAYLANTGLAHPMRDEVLAAHETSWEKIAEACATVASAPVVYQKHMCQHMIAAAPRDWMRSVRHAFLIRPPAAVAASFRKGWSGMGASDLGYRRQVELFDEVCQITGFAPPVVEARDVLERPEAMLRALCGALGAPFHEAMLSWPSGSRASDGVWGAHWYRTVNGSTGFVATAETADDAASVPDELAIIVEESLPFYEQLRGWRLGPVEAGE